MRSACKFCKYASVLSTETSVEPSLQAKQLKLKRARLADDLNDKISHRPGPIELIHKNILPVPALLGKHYTTEIHIIAQDSSLSTSVKVASCWNSVSRLFILQIFYYLLYILIGTGSPKGENSSLDEDSSDGLSPEQPGSQDSPLGSVPQHSPSDMLNLNRNPSPTQVHFRSPLYSFLFIIQKNKST